MLIGGLWLVITVAALIVGWPWNIGAMAATVMGVLLLYAMDSVWGSWRR